jgi:hypothetical protein
MWYSLTTLAEPGDDMDHRLIKGPSVKEIQSEALESYLSHSGFTEFQPGRWCQSGAQAGWSPDLDGVLTPIEVKGGVVDIRNDIYSERVQEIEKVAKAFHYEVKVRNTYTGTK